MLCYITFILFYFTEVFIPTITISVFAFKTQTVGQPLILECEVTTVRGVSSRVDIVWSSNGTELSRLNGTAALAVNNSQVYSTLYSISTLRTSDEGRVIQCEGIIQATSSISSTNTFTLDVIGQCMLALVFNMIITIFSS